MTEDHSFDELEGEYLRHLPALGRSHPSLEFYDPFSLPEPDPQLYQPEEKFASILAKIKPITERVGVRRADNNQILLLIGNYSAVLKKDKEYACGVMIEVGLDVLGHLTIVTVKGEIVKRGGNWGGHDSRLVMAFSDPVHAALFKNDLLHAFLPLDSLIPEDGQALLDQESASPPATVPRCCQKPRWIERHFKPFACLFIAAAAFSAWALYDASKQTIGGEAPIGMVSDDFPVFRQNAEPMPVAKLVEHEQSSTPIRELREPPFPPQPTLRAQAPAEVAK